MTNLDSILESRHITLPTKVHLVKAMVFQVVIHGCESWTIKKAETEELMLLNCGVGRQFRVHWTARRSNQSILKEINPEYALEGLMLKLKLQYFGYLMRTDSFEKTLVLGKTEGRKRRGQQKKRWLDGITDSMDMSLSEHQEVKDRESWHAIVKHNSATEQQIYYTAYEVIAIPKFSFSYDPIYLPSNFIFYLSLL